MVAGYAFDTTTLLTAVIPTGIKVTRMAVHKLHANLSPANVTDVVVFLDPRFGGKLFLAAIWPPAVGGAGPGPPPRPRRRPAQTA